MKNAEKGNMPLYRAPEHYYEESRAEMLKYLPKDAKKILDVGCGAGNFGALIKDKNGAEVWGIDINKDAIKRASEKIDQALLGSVELVLDKLEDNYFDVICFNDVIEHLVDPYSMLISIKSKLSKKGLIVSSIPNVRYHKNLKKLLIEKDWKYEDAGILDRTHLRFFTRKSITRMFNELNFEIITCEGINVTKSLRPYFYNFFSAGLIGLDIRYHHFATVVKSKS